MVSISFLDKNEEWYMSSDYTKAFLDTIWVHLILSEHTYISKEDLYESQGISPRASHGGESTRPL